MLLQRERAALLLAESAQQMLIQSLPTLHPLLLAPLRDVHIQDDDCLAVQATASLFPSSNTVELCLYGAGEYYDTSGRQTCLATREEALGSFAILERASTETFSLGI